jgi:glycine dehydrogenase subunit 1
MAVAATVYLGWLGPHGLEELGRQCMAKARYAAERISDLTPAEMMWPGAEFFKEFAVRTPGDAHEVQRSLLDAGFLVGPAIGDEALLVSVTERRTREEIDRLVKAFGEAVS